MKGGWGQALYAFFFEERKRKKWWKASQRSFKPPIIRISSKQKGVSGGQALYTFSSRRVSLRGTGTLCIFFTRLVSVQNPRGRKFRLYLSGLLGKAFQGKYAIQTFDWIGSFLLFGFETKPESPVVFHHEFPRPDNAGISEVIESDTWNTRPA